MNEFMHPRGAVGERRGERWAIADYVLLFKEIRLHPYR
jgi:hypothetical protein